jgi:hypothetical protein
MEWGGRTRPVEDSERARNSPYVFGYRSQLPTKPVFDRAKRAPPRVVSGKGEDKRVVQRRCEQLGSRSGTASTSTPPPPSNDAGLRDSLLLGTL